MPGGTLDGLVAATEGPIRRSCTDESARRITFALGVDTLVPYLAVACRKWAEDFLVVSYANGLATLSPAALDCQGLVAAQTARLRDRVVQATGRRCDVAEFSGRPCDRVHRDRRIAKALARAHTRILGGCGATFDELGLAAVGAAPTLEARIDAVLDRVTFPARHFALRVFPPLNLGPTALYGSAPVGVRTLDLVDPSRLNRTGTGPRPLKVEIYYPSTPAAVDGVAGDVVSVLGLDLFPTPTFRDVARAPGTFPLVLYSHGSGGVRFESLALAVHLASHGYIVVSADHHGDTLLDSGDAMTAVLTNRPLDLSFLVDQFLAFDAQSGNFFEGAIDGSRIGATGHSYGGYTVMALAVGPFALGTFTDPRIRAILPLDGSAQAFAAQFPAIFSTITIPTLLLGASTSGLASLLPLAFAAIPSGPPVVGYGNFLRAGHNSFPDVCEVPESLVGMLEECQPPVLPWRYVRHIENYLALNFFDATLRGDADALARLHPAVVESIEDVAYQSK